MAKLSACLLSVTLFAGAAAAEPIELRVFEWEGYISTFAAKFEAHAKAAGKDIRLTFRKNPDGSPFYISNADEIFHAVRARASDVVTPTHNYYKGDQEKLLRVLAPLDLARIRHWRDLSGGLADPSFAKADGKVFAAPLLGGSYALAYNADRVTPPPTSWSVLFDPANAGRISVTSAQFEANVFVAAVMSGHDYEDLYQVEKLDRAKIQPLLNKMAGNVRSFWDTNPDVSLMEKDLDYITDYWFGVALANAKGQNWRIAEPKEGQTVWLDTIAIAGHVAEEPAKLEAAHLLIDFMLSPATQADIARTFGSVIVNPKAASGLTAAEVARFKVGDEEFFRDDRLWRPMPSRTRNLYRAMWREALVAAGRNEDAAKLR